MTDQLSSRQARLELDRFRLLYENSLDPIVILEGGPIIACNQAAVEQFRYPGTDAMIGLTPWDISPMRQTDGQLSVDKAIEMIRLAMEKGGHRFSWVHQRCDGTIFPAEVLLTPIRSQGRNLVYAVVRDLSEQRRIEKQVQDSLVFFQSLFNNSADAFLLLEKNIFIDCNQATLKMLRAHDKAQVLSTHPFQLSPEYQPDGRRSTEKADEMIRIALDQGSHRFEWMHRRMDGEVFPVEVLFTPISSGDRTVIFTSWRDISQRKKFETEVIENRNLLQLVMSNIPQAIFWKGRDLTFLGANQAFADDAGFTSPEELIGKSDFDMAWADLAEEYRRDDLSVLKSGIARVNFEEPQITPSGEQIWLRTSKIPIVNAQGDIFAVLGMYDDITESKRLQQQVQESYERRGKQVQLATEIAQEIAAETDPGTLMERVVSLVKERFGYYHTQILRYETAQDSVVLVAGYGEVGARMLAEGHHLPMGVGLIGTAAATGKTMMRPTLKDDPDWRPNPFLPDTQGEIAVPIKLRDRVLGVLDVQSDHPAALSTDDQLLLEGLCGQIAVTMEAANLRLDMQNRLRELDLLYRATSREGWQSYQEAGNSTGGYLYNLTGVEPLPAGVLPVDHSVSASDGAYGDRQQPLQMAEMNTVVVPLTVRGEAIGSIGVIDDPSSPLSEEERQLVELVSDQVAQALESARLFEQSQMALTETQTLYTGSARVIAATNLDQVLQAVVDTSKLSNMDQAIIEIFDRSWDSQPPELVQIAAVWEPSSSSTKEPVGTVYQMAEYPFRGLMKRTEPLVVRNILEDERMDPFTRTHTSEKYNITSLVFWPLVAGGEWFGMLVGQSKEPLNLSNDEIRRISSLVGQAATVIQSLRLQDDMRERVQELSSLQRLMSRDAWIAYQSRAGDESLGYLFDRFDVRPVGLYPPDQTLSGNGGEKSVNPFLPDNGEPVAEVLAHPAEFAAPLAVRGEAIGVLGIRNPDEPLTEEDEAFLQAVSEQVAQALERARLMEQSQKSAVELQAVAEVGTATATILQPDMLLQQVVDLTKQRFGLYHAHIYLLNEDGTFLDLVAGSGNAGRSMMIEGWSIPFDQEDSLVALAARDRAGHIISDVRKQIGHLVNPLLPNTLSELATPMIVGDTLLGVFDVQSDRVNWFTDEDVRTYNTLASQVAVALQNAKLYAEQLAAVERLRELDNMKSAFLANMSHELRTPLNSILGFTQVIVEGLDGDLTDLMVSDLELIEKNGKHLLNLINDILDMAKIEAGRLTLSPEPMSLYDLLDEVIITSFGLARDRNLYVRLEADPDQDWIIMADSVRLRQIFINLIGNSIKFTDRGGVSVELERLDNMADRAASKIQIRINDTGIGIPPSKLEDIFDAFSQVDSSTTRKVGGTGLGLPISRRLVELHGGRLWADSEGLGRGSTFFLELPVGKIEGSIVE